jgi:hypothetical protein
MKKYILGETKEERKLRKARERAGLSLPQKSVEISKSMPQKNAKHKRYVVCLKHGNKYGPEYVNNLYNMVKRNLTLDYEFVCFTENSENIDPEITIMPLPELPVNGWWYKPMFFNPKLELKGTILFLDLDLVIFRNIDNLFSYEPTRFVIIRDFNRHLIKGYNKFNSSVFRLDTGSHPQVYTEFIKNAKSICSRYPGDQDWIRKQITNDFYYWPDEWIQSYKWEMRGKPKYNGAPRGQRDFLTNGDPKIKDATSIAVFHGDPNPHNCKDPWVKENWR